MIHLVKEFLFDSNGMAKSAAGSSIGRSYRWIAGIPRCMGKRLIHRKYRKTTNSSLRAIGTFIVISVETIDTCSAAEGPTRIGMRRGKRWRTFLRQGQQRT